MNENEAPEETDSISERASRLREVPEIREEAARFMSTSKTGEGECANGGKDSEETDWQSWDDWSDWTKILN